MNIVERLRLSFTGREHDSEAERLANLAPTMEKVLKRIHVDCRDPKTPNAMNHKIWIEELGL